MKLEKISINSFKSVIGQEIQVIENCISFIGLNESGKTNILQAIRSLQDNKHFSIKDKSKINGKLPNVSFNFSLDTSEKKHLNNKLNFNLTKNNQDAFKPFYQLSLSDVAITKYLSNLDDTFTTYISTTFTHSIKIKKDFVFIKKDHTIPSDVNIQINDKVFELRNLGALEKKYVPENYLDQYVDLTNITIESWLSMELRNLIPKMRPEVRYWEYDSQFLLPAEITYDEFVDDDGPYFNSAPLFNIFLISKALNIVNEDDLTLKIAEWKEDSGSRRKDSEIVTRDINLHIKKIWPDYDQELKIVLEESKITIHVNDPKSLNMNYYDMNMRSQGFKTFISFVLTVSTEVENGSLENYVLILDEPENHLHPSGVRYMKNELLKLSQSNNYVFFATHSIFMIDRENLRRHIIVSKKNELTKIIPVGRNNILQEEILYQALGTSLDEISIRNRNLLFEGETDVKLFSFYIEKCILQKQNKFKEHEIHDGGGTNLILKFFKAKYIPNDSKWILVLDNDKPGRKLKEELSRNVLPQVQENFSYHYYSEVLDYELEDILPKKIIEKSFVEARKTIKYNKQFEFDIDQSKPISSIINEYCSKNKIRNENLKTLNMNFKVKLEDNIDQLLREISMKKTIKERHKYFKETLPDYFAFINELIKPV